MTGRDKLGSCAGGVRVVTNEVVGARRGAGNDGDARGHDTL